MRYFHTHGATRRSSSGAWRAARPRTKQATLRFSFAESKPSILALAEFEIKRSSMSRKKGGSEKSPVVNLDLFKIVAEASLQFNRYLKETHGFEENMLAYQDKVRADPGEMLGTIGTSGGHGGRGKTDEPMLEDPTDMSTTSESGSESDEESDGEKDTTSDKQASNQEIDEDSQSSSGDEKKRKKVKKEKGKATIKERGKVLKGKDRVKDDRKSSMTRASGSKKKAVSVKSNSGKKNTKVKVKEEETSENGSSGSESE